MELLFELLFDVYGELMLLIIPEKGKSKKYILVSRIIAASVVLGVFALVVWGVILVSDYDNMLGIIPICVGALISILQIAAGIILYKKNH